MVGSPSCVVHLVLKVSLGLLSLVWDRIPRGALGFLFGLGRRNYVFLGGRT